MEVNREELLQQYRKKDTEELLELLREGELTETAQAAMSQVLEERDISMGQVLDEVQEKAQTRREVEQQQRPAQALATIKSSVLGLYVIAALQIVFSMAQPALGVYIGALYGVVLALLAALARWEKAQGAAIAVAVLGGIATVMNLFFPVLLGLRGGSLVISIVTIWLGLRCARAIGVWNAMKPARTGETEAATD